MAQFRAAAILLRRPARSRTSKDTRASASWEIPFRRGHHTHAADFSRGASGLTCDRAGARRASCAPVYRSCRWRWGAAASRPTSARATAARRADSSSRFGFGGGPTAFRVHGPRCRYAGSARPMPGARILPIAATTGRSGGRPMNQATASGVTTASMTCLSRRITTPGPELPAAAAPCSSTSPDQDLAPTAGCIALRLQDLQKLVSRTSAKTRITIHY